MFKIFPINNNYILYDSTRNVFKIVDSPCDEHKIHIQQKPLSFKDIYGIEKIGFKELLANRMSQLVLSVTDNCNLQCDYCIYHSKQKTSALQEMSFETAVRAIDFYMTHSENTNQRAISFYGGEPLKNINLIMRCVNYINEEYFGPRIGYNLTTNALLLIKPEIADFLISNEFDVLVSLDGPNLIHDRYRKTQNGDGSYRYVIDSLYSIWKKDPTFFYKHITINAVYAPPYYPKLINDFFSNLPIGHKKGDIVKTDYFISISPSEKANLKNDSEKSPLTDKKREQKMQQIKAIITGNSNNRVNRLCMIGVRKLFLKANGTLLPCEKVEENDTSLELGNVDSLNNNLESKIMQMMDTMVKAINKKCINCWAMHLCALPCIANTYHGDILPQYCIEQKNIISESIARYFSH